MALDFDSAIRFCADVKASDLHVSVGQVPSVRIEGEMSPYGKDPVELAEFSSFVLQAGYRGGTVPDGKSPCDQDFSLNWRTESHMVRMRANLCVRLGCPSLTLRFMRELTSGIDELSLPPILHKVCLQHRGLFLVTGPTGSGKTTTLGAMIEEINRNRACKIVTVEDPVEYIHTPKKAVVWQRETGEDTASFAAALKHVLRQDPDVIMIGELRDLETVSAAVTAAETGHLVLSTLHTSDAAQSVDRIVDVFPPHQQQQIRIQLSLSLMGICSQQLVPGLSGSRVCVTEILMSHPAMRSCIRDGKTAQLRTVIQTNAAAGMWTMDQCLANLVNGGKISQSTAMEYSVEPSELSRLLSLSTNRS